MSSLKYALAVAGASSRRREVYHTTICDGDCDGVAGQLRASAREAVKGFIPVMMGTPLVDGRLTVRCMRRVDWTVDCMGDQVAEAIVCFGVPDPQGKRVVLMNQTKRW